MEDKDLTINNLKAEIYDVSKRLQAVNELVHAIAEKLKLEGPYTYQELYDSIEEPKEKSPSEDAKA